MSDKPTDAEELARLIMSDGTLILKTAEERELWCETLDTVIADGWADKLAAKRADWAVRAYRERLPPEGDDEDEDSRMAVIRLNAYLDDIRDDVASLSVAVGIETPAMYCTATPEQVGQSIDMLRRSIIEREQRPEQDSPPDEEDLARLVKRIGSLARAPGPLSVLAVGATMDLAKVIMREIGQDIEIRIGSSDGRGFIKASTECDGNHARDNCPAEECIRRDTSIVPGEPSCPTIGGRYIEPDSDGIWLAYGDGCELWTLDVFMKDNVAHVDHGGTLEPRSSTELASNYTWAGKLMRACQSAGRRQPSSNPPPEGETREDSERFRA